MADNRPDPITDAAQPHLVAGPYGPYILTGQRSRYDARAENRRHPEEYALWYVQDGSATLVLAHETRRLVPPAGVVLWPSLGARVRIPAASTWWHLRFDPVYQPRRRFGQRFGAFVHASADVPAPPERVWGIQPSPLVPEPLLRGFANMIRFCTSHWWQGDLAYARANLRLGEWLLSWAAWYRGQMSGAEEHWITRIEREAVEQLGEGLTVADMAAMAGMSRKAFQRHYRRHRRIGPGRFLRQQRIELACHLLEATTITMARVARRCGFGSLSSFSHCFRAATGVSPSAWRREHMA